MMGHFGVRKGPRLGVEQLMISLRLTMTPYHIRTVIVSFLEFVLPILILRNCESVIDLQVC